MGSVTDVIDKWIERFSWTMPAFLYMKLQRLQVQQEGREAAESPIAGLAGADDWAPSHYASYFATSAPVYSAVRLRADAVARPPLMVYRRVAAAGVPHRERVGPEHPAQRLLDRVNPHWTGGDLWRATETYLNLYGVAYWSVERDDLGMPVELWPLRPDRVRLVPDENEYIRGYLYTGHSGEQIAYAADEIVRLRYFNPLDEYAGLSPIAPVRLTLDMGRDALLSNRSGLANDGSPGVVIHTEDNPSEDEVKRLLEKWESRFSGPLNRLRPVVLSAGMEASQLGFSPKDMEYLGALRWTVEDVARAFNVPKPLLHDLERATYSNIETARRMFWETCVVPELRFFEEKLNQSLLPMFGDSSLMAEFDTSSIEALRESESERARRIQIYVSEGIMTPDEARAELGLGPHPGESGSTRTGESSGESNVRETSSFYSLTI